MWKMACNDRYMGLWPEQVRQCTHVLSRESNIWQVKHVLSKTDSVREEIVHSKLYT